MTVALSASNIQVRYGRRVIFDKVDITIHHGRLTALIGPNGSGKSSLLRVLAGVQAANGGTVTGKTRPVLVAPISNPPSDLTAADLASYGLALRRPPWIWTTSAADRQKVDSALERCGLAASAHAAVAELSAGEIQRAWVAAALAMQSEVLLIDEPTTHLDLRFQMEVLGMLRGLTHDGVAVVVALHDLTLAARFADEIALLADSQLVVGPPEAVLTTEMLSAAYGVSVNLHRHPQQGYLICLPA